jgi:hypothetical protein
VDSTSFDSPSNLMECVVTHLAHEDELPHIHIVVSFAMAMDYEGMSTQVNHEVDSHSRYK